MTVQELINELEKYAGDLVVDVECSDCGLADIDSVEYDPTTNCGKGTVTIDTY